MANYIGDILYVAKALPAANTTTAFEALTWVKVAGIQMLPKFGLTHNVIDVDDLETGITTGEKGMASGVEATVTVREIVGDAGQQDLIDQALDSAGTASFKIVRKPSGAGTPPVPATGDKVEYAQGFIHSYQPNDNNGQSNTGFTVTFRQNMVTVYGTQP